MIDAIRDGVAPDSEEADSLVEEHREALSEFFSGHASQALHHVSRVHQRRAIPRALRFAAGCFAQWLADAIECVARRQGLDVQNPTSGVNAPDGEVGWQ